MYPFRPRSLKIIAFIFDPWTDKSRNMINLHSDPSGSSDPEGFTPSLFCYRSVNSVQGRAIPCPFQQIHSDLLGFSWIWFIMNGVGVRLFSATPLIQLLTSSYSYFANKKNLQSSFRLNINLFNLIAIIMVNYLSKENRSISIVKE